MTEEIETEMERFVALPLRNANAHGPMVHMMVMKLLADTLNEFEAAR